VVADSTTGDLIGEISWKRRDFQLSYTDVWLDDQTLLNATVPHFVAWRPSTGELFRVTDARSIDEHLLGHQRGARNPGSLNGEAACEKPYRTRFSPWIECVTPPRTLHPPSSPIPKPSDR